MAIFKILSNISETASKAKDVISSISDVTKLKNKSNDNYEEIVPTPKSTIDRNTEVAEVINTGITIPTRINNIEDMKGFLSQIESQASSSLQAMIQAQTTVIKYIQSPTLIDSSLDTMILSLRESLSECENENQKTEYRKLFHRIIANYIFFIDARFKVEIENDKEAGMQLLSIAGETLSQNIVSVATMALSGPVGASAISKMTISNIFDSNKENIFATTFKWFNAEKRINEKTKDFYDSLLEIIKKLDKYQPAIGKSMLIYGAIERYAKAITGFIMNSDIKKIEYEIEQIENALKCNQSIKDYANIQLQTLFGNPISDTLKLRVLRTELENAKKQQATHNSSFINIHKSKDAKQIAYLENEIFKIESCIKSTLNDAKERLKAEKEKYDDYYNSIMAVAAKYDDFI